MKLPFRSAAALATAVALVACALVDCKSSDPPSGGDANGGNLGGAQQPGKGSSDSPAGGSVATPAACPKPAGPTGYRSGVSISAANKTRSYELYVPAANRVYPIVFVFHGSGGNGKDVRIGLPVEVASKDGAIFVYPTADGGEWDLDDEAASNKDIALVDAIIASLAQTYCIDPARIFATGMSNGAYFSNQLGCRRGNVVRAIAPHSGGGPFGGKYDDDGNLVCPTPPVPAMIIHGQSDGTVRLSEGQASRDEWRRFNGCKSTSKGVDPSPCIAYDGCARPTRYCEIRGLDHVEWSQAPAAIWAFFASF